MQDQDESGPNKNKGFQDVEVEKMRRLVEFAKAGAGQAWIPEARKNFYYFFKQHDERRGTNFLETFPEMADFWSLCESTALGKI